MNWKCLIGRKLGRCAVVKRLEEKKVSDTVNSF